MQTLIFKILVKELIKNVALETYFAVVSILYQTSKLSKTHKQITLSLKITLYSTSQKDLNLLTQTTVQRIRLLR